GHSVLRLIMTRLNIPHGGGSDDCAWINTLNFLPGGTLENATNVLHEIMGMPDQGFPEEVLEHSKCVAVVPHIVKGGFIFGGNASVGVGRCLLSPNWKPAESCCQ